MIALFQRRSSSRTRARPVAFALVLALLWSQFAMVVHACPMLLPPRPEMAATHAGCHEDAAAPASASRPDTGEAQAAMPAAPHENDDAALCERHCRQGDQDRTSAQPPPVLAAPSSHFVIAVAPVPGLAALRPQSLSLPERATSPPKAIAQCCFRI